VLTNLLTPEEAASIDIVSNDADVFPDGRWAIKYRHPSSGYGHDKSQAILPYRRLPNPPLIFFFGDGVSDLSAARHADILFVKDKGDGENDLAAFCEREKIPHVMFKDFGAALKVVKDVVEGKKTKEEVLSMGRAE